MRVLFCGLDGGVIEAAKNVTLAGVEAVTLRDDNVVAREDLPGSFSLREGDLGANVSADGPRLWDSEGSTRVFDALSAQRRPGTSARRCEQRQNTKAEPHGGGHR